MRTKRTYAELADHLDRYAGNQIVRNAIAGNPTLWGAVKEFYDLENLDANESQTGLERPHEDLVNILAPFTEDQPLMFWTSWTEEVDITKLSYEDVREDSRRLRDSNIKIANPFSMFWEIIRLKGLGAFRHKEEFYSLHEYGNLGLLAQNADSFLDHTYRAHFVKNHFLNTGEGTKK